MKEKKRVLRCTEDFPMKETGKLALIKGKDYPIYGYMFDEVPEFVVDSELYKGHIMPFDEETINHFDIVTLED